MPHQPADLLDTPATVDSSEATSPRGRNAARNRPAATLLLEEALGAGVLSVRQAAAALVLEPRSVTRAVAQGERLPLGQQRALALLVLTCGAEHPHLVRRAHALLGQVEAASRMERGDTTCHSLAPVIWR